MSLAASTGRILLAAAAVAWVLAGLTPAGLRICRQADGVTELGLGCSCDECHGDPGVTSCCSPAVDAGSGSLVGNAPPEDCCSCSEVTAVPAAGGATGLEPARIDVLVADLGPIRTPVMMGMVSTSRSSHLANAPPGAWQPDTIRLLI